MSSFILVLFSSFCCLSDSFHQMRSERGAQSEKKYISLVHVVQSFSFTTAKLGICWLFLPILTILYLNLKCSCTESIWYHFMNFLYFFKCDSKTLLEIWQSQQKSGDYVRKPNNGNNIDQELFKNFKYLLRPFVSHPSVFQSCQAKMFSKNVH